MNWRTSKTLTGGRAMAVLSLTGALLTLSGGAAIAGSDPSASQAAPVGAWVIQVTLRDCATDAAIAPPFNSLVTFHRGGTLSESAGSLGLALGQRSSGHGIWNHLGGRRYHQRMVALINFDTPANLPGTPGFNPSLPVSPGFFAGWQTVTHTIRITDTDHLTSSGTNDFYKASGELYRSGCSTAVAQRFE
jgi:hypothetical protein